MASKKGAIKSEVPNGGLSCEICKKSGFSSSYKLKSHMFMHKAVSARYKCSYCCKEYFRSDEYSRHMATHTGNQKVCYCDHCGRGFVDKRNLVQHLNIHDDQPIRSTRFTCVACGADYCERRLLKYHIRKEHLNLGRSRPLYMKKKLNDTWIEKVKHTKSYVEITKVNSNVLIIKKSKLRGEEATKSKDKKDIFKQYISSVFAANDDYYSKAICDYCGKEMLKKSIITHIRERHMNLRRFHCEVCDRTFFRHYQLSLHKCGKPQRKRVIKAEGNNMHKFEKPKPKRKRAIKGEGKYLSPFI